MTPPKPPGLIPDPELPPDRDDPERNGPEPETSSEKDAEPSDPAEDLPRVSPATRRPRPKEQPYEEDNPDDVE